jgi:membrane protein DedA with SNARE-associated domain
MHLFSNYVQPITHWIHQNPNWALFITFLIALLESLAVIGSIIPGSVTMTAIGMLAGSGVMRIDLTLLSAILGAMVGDGLSYLLGYTYSERLGSIWPFKAYPTWFLHGKIFFDKHGGASVFFGRFIGPLRSIIPVIAGIMHMRYFRFFLANFFSAIGWAILYVIPGVIIGSSSTKLSPEGATELFLCVLIILGVVWIIGVLVKHIFISYKNKK